MKPYNDYNSYLKNKYGAKVYRIGLDAGFTCPNRGGTKGRGGCIYCNGDGSRSPYVRAGESITKQLESRIRILKKAKGAGKFIAYFQAFTNTYASLAELKKIYDEILPFKEIVGISIGTRPDAIDRDKLKLIASYKGLHDIWMEYGLQSIHDRTLKAIKRGHGFNDFVGAVELTARFAIPVCAHVILGLPGETREDMIQTARGINELKIAGVKIHVLHVLKGSAMEKPYADGKIRVLGQDEYAELVCDFLENLSGDIIIQRLTGQGDIKTHIAPEWALDKVGTIKKIEEIFARRGSRQGCKVPSLRGREATEAISLQ